MDGVDEAVTMTEPREADDEFGDVELEPHRSYKAPAAVRRLAAKLGFRSPNDPATERE
ncbi:hypothetical protein ABSL23_01785 [Halobacterium sp. NMX12-1]|uniref:Type II toxin-antitoxin system HicA family toxin n=1 Tax=Halobacterium sp. NMX12-1 TaxID=3166650 RepID=A0AAU8CD16_9EURY